jgi:hypothetical protein
MGIIKQIGMSYIICYGNYQTDWNELCHLLWKIIKQIGMSYVICYGNYQTDSNELCHYLLWKRSFMFQSLLLGTEFWI